MPLPVFAEIITQLASLYRQPSAKHGVAQPSVQQSQEEIVGEAGGNWWASICDLPCHSYMQSLFMLYTQPVSACKCAYRYLASSSPLGCGLLHVGCTCCRSCATRRQAAIEQAFCNSGSSHWSSIVAACMVVHVLTLALGIGIGINIWHGRMRVGG